MQSLTYIRRQDTLKDSCFPKVQKKKKLTNQWERTGVRRTQYRARLCVLSHLPIKSLTSLKRVRIRCAMFAPICSVTLYELMYFELPF